MSFFIYLDFNRDMKADGNGARLDQHSVFCYPGDYVADGRQNYIVKVRFIGKPSKC